MGETRLPELPCPIRAQGQQIANDGNDKAFCDFWCREQVEEVRDAAYQAGLEAGAAKEREDAERYRVLRAQNWHDSPLCVVIAPRANVRLGTFCPSGELLDKEVDALRAQKGTP